MDKPIRIFLVDDNEIDLVVNAKLVRLGRITEDVISYHEGALFISAVAEMSDFANFQNVLLLDIMMPKMNGFECAIAFGELSPKITDHFKVFVLSSSIDRGDIRRAEEIPSVLRVLEKPLDTYLLKGLISSNS